ncbi:hypothetical protein WT37_24835 [Burkholderia territorii]|nr:hypothetical protein WT37_24835 [Burkholderia territorii]
MVPAFSPLRIPVRFPSFLAACPDILRPIDGSRLDRSGRLYVYGKDDAARSGRWTASRRVAQGDAWARPDGRRYGARFWSEV